MVCFKIAVLFIKKSLSCVCKGVASGIHFYMAPTVLQFDMHFIHRYSTFLFVILSIDEFFSAIMKKFELIKFLQNVDDMLNAHNLDIQSISLYFFFLRSQKSKSYILFLFTDCVVFDVFHIIILLKTHFDNSPFQSQVTSCLNYYIPNYFL